MRMIPMVWICKTLFITIIAISVCMYGLGFIGVNLENRCGFVAGVGAGYLAMCGLVVSVLGVMSGAVALLRRQRRCLTFPIMAMGASLCFIGAVFVIPVVMSLPPQPCASKCQEQLSHIREAAWLYALDHNNLMPTNFAELVPYCYESKPDAVALLFVCPATGHRAGTLSEVDRWSDYTVLKHKEGGVTMDNKSAGFIACRPANHSNERAYILLVGGHIETYFDISTYSNSLTRSSEELGP